MLPLQALKQAIVSARETKGLIHHSDHVSQYVSVVYNQRLAQHGITASTGTVGDWYDNALAENVNGSYKNELIHTCRWNDVVEVEIATFEWVNWWNEDRIHQSLGYRTPAEVEDGFWEQHESREIMENKVNTYEQNPGHFKYSIFCRAPYPREIGKALLSQSPGCVTSETCAFTRLGCNNCRLCR